VTMEHLIGEERREFTFPAEYKLALMRQLEGTLQTSSVEEALERAHLYFRVCAGRVIDSEEAVVLLARLGMGLLTRESQWDGLDLCSIAIPLAMLAAAGFCEVEPDSVCITDSGRRFLAHLEED